MQQNEKIQKELQALRKENERLKAELSQIKSSPSTKDTHIQEDYLRSIYEFSRAIPWSYDLVKHKLEGPFHFRKIWTKALPDGKDDMDDFFLKVHKDDRGKIKDIWNKPAKHPEFEFNFRYHGDDGILHYLNTKGKCIFDASGKAVKIIGINQEITEQQRIERKLLLKEKQLHDAYKLANLSAWSYNFETHEFTPSEQLRKIWTPPKKNIKDAFLKRVHPEDREKILEAIKDPEKYSVDFLCRVIGDDNNTYYLLCRCAVEYNESKKPLKAHGVTWNITEKKLHEEQKLQTESRLRSFFEKVGLGFWEYRIGESAAYFSKEMEKLFNLNGRKGLVTKEDVYERIHFQDVERVKTSFEEVLSGKNSIYECMYRLLCKSNQYIWVLARGIPILDNKGQVDKVIGCLEDLSQSTRYNAIKERLNFMQKIADALPIPIYYKDMNGRYIGHNEAFLDFIKSVGTANSTLVGSSVLDVHSIHNVDVGLEVLKDEKAFLSNPDKNFEKTYSLISLSGEKVFIINKKSILHDQQGNPKYLVCGILDITEYEEAKAKARIHQEQLLLADKMKSLGILISGVAHEINNPNHFININVSLLQKMWRDLKPLVHKKIENSPIFYLGNIPSHKLEESIDDLLFGIRDGSERISRIVDSMKAYIRNVPSDIKEIFNLHDAIENVVFLLKNQMMKATDKFTIKHKCKRLLVIGIQQQIEQVIINVLQNACQALTSKQQSICIETGTAKSGKMAVIKVTDTGIGIEPQNLKFVTDPFFTTKRKIGGTGLGLSISSSILEEHKGCFNFISEPGKGTVVEIILPLVHDSRYK